MIVRIPSVATRVASASAVRSRMSAVPRGAMGGYTRLLPTDTSKPVLQDSHSMTLHFTLKRDPRAMIPGPREGKLLRSVGVKLQLMNG